MKMKSFGWAVFFITAYLLLSYTFLKIWFAQSRNTPITSVQLQNVIVHIDLKGTPLKISYLESLLPLLKKYGVTGLLMEYEDMFPYEGKLVNLSAEYCYSKPELKNFITKATNSGFEIIPLIQTFGHLEYALKLAEFKHLREVPQFPDSICPSKLESKQFLEDMTTQIINFHTAISPLKYIHIGCDEVFHLNQCHQCKKRILPNKDLFVQHIKSVAEVVKTLSAETTVLIWDDMLRDIGPREWRNIQVFNNVHPVCWDYGSILQISHQNLFKYHKKFPHIWIASAYKGADGRTATLPDLKNRFLNHFSWLKLILGYKFGGDRDVYKFTGIILTGWSRYSHMDPPCELIPASIPSLVLNLLAIQKFKSGISDIKINGDEEEVVKDICNKYINIELNRSFNCLISGDNIDFSMCKFEAKELFNMLRHYTLITNEVYCSLNNEEDSILSYEYYLQLGTININNMLQTRGLLESKLEEIIKLEKVIISEMTKYYHNDFVMEYVNYKSLSTKGPIVKFLNLFDKYALIQTWERRITTNVSMPEIRYKL